MLSTVFLYMFLVGLGLTLVSALLGVLDASGLGHFGHGDTGAGHVGHDFGHGHGGDLSAHGDAGAHGDTGAHGHAATVSPINFQTLVSFLMGFGGVGYIATRGGWGALLLVLLAATAGGLATGWIVLKFMRFLVRNERPMPPTSYVGITGKLTLAIRENGTGEVVYEHVGTRQVLAARSADGRPIAKGEQVVVLRYEKGIAYVEPWQDLMGGSHNEA